ncbi:hypothetical protein M9458_010619, partial [Cirrhinus mrigala]
EDSPVLFARPDLDMVSFGGSEDDMLDSMSLAASDTEEQSGSVNDPAPLPSADTSSPWTGTGMDAELFRVMTRAVDELGLEWSPPEEPSHSLLDEWFLSGRHQAPRQWASPFFLEVHEELTKSWRAPCSARLCTSSSSALTSVDDAEDKGYEKLPPLDESVAAHLCPFTPVTSALAGRAYASAGQAGSALHSMAVLQVFQAKLLAGTDKSALDFATLMELRSATDLALRATKATAQAIGRSMANLVLLERHLWLTLTEIKDADKVPFLDVPLTPTGLFGPAVEGFAECFSAAQKTSQAMRHFLPKHSSSTAASSRPNRRRCCFGSANQTLPLPKASGTPAQAGADLRDRKRKGQSLAVAGPTPQNQPLEPILPPATRAEAWQAIPGVGVVPTLVVSEDAHLLRSEVMNLLEKGAVEVVHPAQSESGFYSRYFLVDKKDGGLRPILDLRHLNRALMKRPFKMITLKQILSHIRPGDWFFSLDLKDAYFHIQIAPHHRRFLRFAFERVAYQFTVLPFGLSLAPRTFTKCMDAALSPLRKRGIRILNYLDDWLVLAQSEAELLSHRSLLLSHLECLGHKVNLAKSALHPSRRISFLGAVFDSAQMRTTRLAASFKIGASPPQNVSKDARPYGLSIPSAKVRPASYAAPSVLAETTGVDQACVEALIPWKNSQWMERGVPLGMVCRRKVVTTDASNTDWGALCDGKPAFGHWTKAQEGIHINCLEMLAVCRALHFFLQDLKGHHVLVLSDSMTVVSYINRQGGLSSKRLFTLVEGLLEQTEPGGRFIRRRRRQLSLPIVLFEEQGCVGPRLAQPPPLCFSPDVLDSSSTQASQGTETKAPSGGPSLEKPALVLRAVPAARSSPLAHSPETGPPLSGEWDNMAPPAQAVGPAPLVSGRESMNLSESVLNTISQARAPSTRRLYALKWSVFSAWCSTHSEDPVSCDISVILSFLQELLDRGRSPSMLKVYVAAIMASHAPIAGQPVGRNNLVVQFLKGCRRLNPPRPLTIPTWDLSTGLRALKGPPFEPLPGSDLRPLMFKAALLLALASDKRMGDLQALSVNPSCLEFGPGDSKVILKPRHGYVPKVPSTLFRAQVIALSALPSSEEDQEQSEQLFVYFGGHNKGHPVTKQRISRWIVNAIMLAYSSLGLQCPIRVRAHSTRGMASSWAWSSGVSIAEICAPAGWALPSTFIRFYNLDVPALQARVFSAGCLGRSLLVVPLPWHGVYGTVPIASSNAVRVYYRKGTYSVTIRERVLHYWPCHVAARLSRHFSRSNLRILWQNGRLYSRTAPHALAGFGGLRHHRLVQHCCRDIGSFVSLHDPMSVQFHCVIKKGFSQGEKRTFSHSV